MTKLKKKKIGKRKKTSQTAELISIAKLTSDSFFSEFCSSVNLEESDWINYDSYRWGCSPNDLRDSESEWGKLLFQKKISQEGRSLPAASEFYRNPGDATSRELLLSVLTLARFVDRFSADQVSDFFERLDHELSAGCDNLLATDPTACLLLYGELPLTLALLFPHLEEAETWWADGRAVLNQILEETLDGNGIPKANYLSQTGLILACSTRCLMLCQLRNRECFTTDVKTQFEYFVRQVIALLRKDGTLAFGDHDVDLRRVIQSAMTCYHDEDDANIALHVLPHKLTGANANSGTKSGAGKGKKRMPSVNSLPESSDYSEWAEVAIMQSEWLPKSPKLILDFHGRRIHAELTIGQVLLGGEIEHQIQCGDQATVPKTDWEVVCWHSDQDGDFLELECKLDNGATWQKHFLLARNELFLLAGDVILNSPSSGLRVENRWPLADEIGFGVSQENREIFLTRKAKTVASILPLSLPEWRRGRTDSDLEITNSILSFQQTSTGNQVYAPLFIDLDAKRCRKPLTWRQLTVAEQLEVVPSDKAAAFRVQVGDQQWLVYRSLTPPANRTFLGQNLSVEFFVGTLESDGTCSEIISVD